MDLNQLLYHHQMALLAVIQARRDGHLLPNFDLPRYYAKRIDQYRERRGLTDRFAELTDGASEGPKADPPISDAIAGYPISLGDTLVVELLINEALAMMAEERASFEVEDVVGRLADIQDDIWMIGRDIYRALGLDEHKLAALAAKLPVAPDPHREGAVAFQPFRSRSEDGIEHLYVEQFRVGQFRYSNIDDARAALARQRSGAGPTREQANDV